MNLNKVKREDRIKYLKEHKVISDPIEIYACADGEHFVVKQGYRKNILNLSDYNGFLNVLNELIFRLKVKKIQPLYDDDGDFVDKLFKECGVEIKENNNDRQHN